MIEASDAELIGGDLRRLMAEASAVRDAGWGNRISYSRKVFLPLTRLCRDVCHYCTFAAAPREVGRAYLSIDAVLDIARAGAAAGCKEALFTLGDKPELRYPAARRALEAMGFATTIDYLAHAAAAVRAETGLLPHLNPGLLDPEDYARLRPLAPSMGLMLESVSERLCAPGGPHHGSPDKWPQARLASIAHAGEAQVPFTTGLLIGIGEDWPERIAGLRAIAALHARYGHIQEVIVQNFRPKPGTRMAGTPEAGEEDLLRTIAAARLILPAEVAIQAPPNLNAGRIEALIAAGINDLGGISPVTIDHVNPTDPWPELEPLARRIEEAGHVLVERLTAYPAFLRDDETWLDAALRAETRAAADSDGLARDGEWSPGEARTAPFERERLPAAPALAPSLALDRILGKAAAGQGLSEAELVTLFATRGEAARAVTAAADALRRETQGDRVSYVVNRNINYTNICTFSCGFCAFSKSSTKAGLRERPYLLEPAEVAERAREAWARGATEVCLQGGIHPSYDGETYVAILRAVKRACPAMHVHGFSPLEVQQGARTLGMPMTDYLAWLKEEGLGSLPGTAAEILDDAVRAQICPDKLSTDEWLEVVGAAHRVGLPTTSTIMFGHVERPVHWARHLLRLRALQMDTGGFTEFVPLPFVHMASPLFLRGTARRGPTWRETVLMHAVGRIALHRAIPSIQASWVKLGLDGAVALLDAGVNDLGGVLMNESISRAAGAAHGQELSAAEIAAAARDAGRAPWRRSTLYRPVDVPEPA